MIKTESRRKIKASVSGVNTSDGAGVRLKRIIGHRELLDLDPFLLFDEFKSDNPDDYIAGFPSHPHRGFETVTYMVQGTVEHKDSAGTTGTLLPGGAQWMTAGRGIVHSEIPKQKDGLLWGFQLWVNLPAKSKMIPPKYQDIDPAAIPEVFLDGGGKARIVAGEIFGVKGPVMGLDTSPLYMDISLPGGTSTLVPVDQGKNAFIYVMEGQALIEGSKLSAGQLAVLEDGDMVEVAGHDSGCRIILAAGYPIGEPVARYGPFVMNTEAEIDQAVKDYQEGRIKD